MQSMHGSGVFAECRAKELIAFGGFFSSHAITLLLSHIMLDVCVSPRQWKTFFSKG